MRASKQSDARARSRADDRVGRAGRGGRSPTLLLRFPDVRICAIAQLRMRSSRSTCRGRPRRGARGAGSGASGGRVRPAPSARVAPRGRRTVPRDHGPPRRADSRPRATPSRCCCGVGPCRCLLRAGRVDQKNEHPRARFPLAPRAPGGCRRALLCPPAPGAPVRRPARLPARSRPAGPRPPLAAVRRRLRRVHETLDFLTGPRPPHRTLPRPSRPPARTHAPAGDRQLSEGHTRAAVR